jgi:hypothetical protein
MDPLSALIGGGMSLIGGLMNTSSAQAINTQNLQQQMWLAQNAIQMKVKDANKAGINPLAALGVSSPGFTGAVPTEPGAGLMAAGKGVMSERIDPTVDVARKLALDKVATEIESLRANNTNTMIQMAMNEEALSRLHSKEGKYWVPSGWSEPSVGGMLGGALHDDTPWNIRLPGLPSWMQHLPSFGGQGATASDYSTP